MEEFEIIIRNIFHLVAEYGITNKPLDFRFPEKITEKEKEEFLIQVHKGFRLGQEQIIKEILPLLRQQEKLKLAEKEAKQAKNKNELAKIGEEKGLIAYKVQLLRHFADFIAWQVFKNDYYKARRFYSGNRTRPDLLNSNLESVLAAVNAFHSEDERNFALITDLTSFVDIGDIILQKTDGTYIIECKSGKVQQRVFEFIEEIEKDEFDAKKVDYSDKNHNFFDQVERTLNQIKKGSRAIEFLKKEEGIDPFSETKINVFEAAKPREYYFKYLFDLIEQSKKNDSSYGEVEEVIYIGIYRNTKIPPSGFVFKYIVDKIYEKSVIVDYLNILNLPLKEPLFFKPFGSEVIFDLMFGRLKIFAAINLDKFIELFNQKGIDAKWMNRKETQKLLDSKNKYKPFMFKRQAIKITVNGKALTLGDSFIIYLLLDNITPSSLVERYHGFK